MQKYAGLEWEPEKHMLQDGAAVVVNVGHVEALECSDVKVLSGRYSKPAIRRKSADIVRRV